ncbi:MAG: hypothetical protein K9K78_06875, partial [Spirochaetales bacterium]|nr:hypothetical protein [Spirochaetales bacterium]
LFSPSLSKYHISIQKIQLQLTALLVNLLFTCKQDILKTSRKSMCTCLFTVRYEVFTNNKDGRVQNRQPGEGDGIYLPNDQILYSFIL